MNLKSFISSILVLLVFTACKRRDDEFVGPAQCPSNFSFTTPFTVEADKDLKTGPLQMTAGFNEDVEWTVTITGLTSGASKTYTGTSDTIGIDWDGRPNTEPFFQDEAIDVALRIKCVDLAPRFTRNIIKNDFSNATGMVADFDNSGVAGWITYGVFVTVNAVSTDTAHPSSPAGGNFWRMTGTDPAGTSWYHGGMERNVAAIMGALSTDPANVYFNAYVCGDQGTTEAQFVLREGAVLKIYRTPIDWTGWRMLSVPLTDFADVATGTPITNPQNVNLFGASLAPFPQPVVNLRFNFDFVIFTEGGPFFSE